MRAHRSLSFALILALTSCGGGGGGGNAGNGGDDGGEVTPGALLAAKGAFVLERSVRSAIVSVGSLVRYDISVENRRDVATSVRVVDEGPRDSSGAVAADKSGPTVVTILDETGATVNAPGRVACRETGTVDCDVLLDPLWSAVLQSSWLPALGVLVNTGLLGSPLSPIGGEPFGGQIVTDRVTVEVVEDIPEDCDILDATLVFVTEDGEQRVGRVADVGGLGVTLVLLGEAFEGRVTLEGTGERKEIRVDARGLWIRRGDPVRGDLRSPIVFQGGVPSLGPGELELGIGVLSLGRAPVSRGCAPASLDLDLDLDAFGRAFQLAFDERCRAELIQQATGQSNLGDAVVEEGERVFASLTSDFEDFTEYWDLEIDLVSGAVTGRVVITENTLLVDDRAITGQLLR